MFFDENGNELQTSQRYHHPGGGGFGNVVNGLNGQSPSGRQAKANGRKWFSRGTNEIDQTDNLDAIIRKHAQPDADRLHKASPTRANFKVAEPSSWNIDKIKHITFKADRMHGFNHGRAGRIEVLDDYRVRIHK